MDVDSINRDKFPYLHAARDFSCVNLKSMIAAILPHGTASGTIPSMLIWLASSNLRGARKGQTGQELPSHRLNRFVQVVVADHVALEDVFQCQPLD
jgi:hypothetical protein